MTAALLGLLLSAAPVRAEPHPVTAQDLLRLVAELATVTARAQQLSAELDRASAQDGGLRVAYDRAEQARRGAKWALDARARQVYMAMTGAPLGSWMQRVASPDAQFLAHRGQTASLQVDQRLVDAVAEQTRQLGVLQRRSNALRRSLLGRARAVLQEQDHARDLLAQAQALAAAEHAAQVAMQLEAQRSLLDEVSTATTLVLAPGQQSRARRALDREGPVIALLEASGSSLPFGYVPTGEVLAGTASWYGPGFIGNPTASGAPYDPERLTCAHKALPLGTVIHVEANGRAVNCLVNDRGPYAGNRILDMSRAGSRALGYSGLAQVVVTVLMPTR